MSPYTKILDQFCNLQLIGNQMNPNTSKVIINDS